MATFDIQPDMCLLGKRKLYLDVTLFYVLLTSHLYTILKMKPTWRTFYSSCISSVLFTTSTCFGPL